MCNYRIGVGYDHFGGMFALGLERRNVGRVAGTNVFEGMFRSGDVDIDIPSC